MVYLMVFFGCLIYWLLRETDYLKVNLMPKLKFARYEVYQALTKRIPKNTIRKGGTVNPDNPYDTPTYRIILSPGIDNVLCGYDWLDKHCADLVDYVPKVELYYGNGYRQTFTLKKPELMKQIIKINTGKKYFRQLLASNIGV